MATTSILPSAAHRRRKFSLYRPAAWLVARATDPETGFWLVTAFALLHAVVWTLILTNLKSAQDIHMDVAEAFAWGQKFQFGYGKHPPLSGWIAGLWFRFFPVTDWSAYGLAMAVIAVGLVVCWMIALRVVDRRRAFFVVVMLALYPIFNFKGFKYNADLVQLATLPPVVLAYLYAFEKRNVVSGILLGLAGALALMTKYWVLTMIGAIGIAALLHPQRLYFLRSPAPWAAIVTMVVALIPHLLWLRQVDFAPLTYAGDVYSISNRALNLQLVLGYIGHNAGLLAACVVLAALALGWSALLRRPSALFTRSWSRGPNPGVNLSQALNVWLIQFIVAIGPPIGAVIFEVYMKTDWGISLFFLVPLALVAIPYLRIPGMALFRISVIWFVISAVMLFASPTIARREIAANPDSVAIYGARAELARELSEAWHSKFASRWAAVAGTTETIMPLVFYSPDHPAPFTPGEIWTAGLVTEAEAKRLGFIGVFDPNDGRLPAFEKWIDQNAPHAERSIMTTRRFFDGHPGPSVSWKVYIAPPAE